MPNGMDYSLKNRIIDGTGMILDTEPGTPDDVGTYVTENQLADWIKGKILFTGYYHNGNFYSDSGHTTLLAKVNGALYIDQTNANKALYVCLSSTYQSLTEEAQVQAIIDGLNDGTIVPLKAKQDQNGNVIDQTYETKAEASDLKSALTSLDHRVQNLEQAKGSYVVQNYKDGSVTPSGKGAWSIVEGLRGVSRVVNMLFKTSASGSNGGISYTNSNGTITLSGTSTSTYTSIFDRMPILGNHSYLIFFADVVNPNSLSFQVGSLNSIVKSYIGTPKVATAVNNIASSYMGMESYSSGTNFDGISYKFFIRDLNVYFGTSDLSFLGVDDSAKLATIQTNYPHLLTPSEYGTRIVDSSYSGVRAKGVNLWDEVWQAGGLNISTGADDDTRTNRIRSENYIPVNQYKTYYYLDNSETWWAYFYDADKNFIGRNAVNGTTSFYALAGSFFMRFETWNGYGNVYKHDVQISEVFNNTVTTLNTTYHPYMENTLSLSFQGKSAGSVYDSCEPNVEVEGVAKKRTTERTYSVDLSTLDWTLFSDYGEYWATQDLANIIKKGFDNNTPANILCEKYPRCLSLNEFISSAHQSDTDACGSNGTNGAFFIRNGSNTVKPTGDAIIERDEYIVTLSDPILDNTLLTEAYGRMATVQTGTVVDGSFDMGFINL